MNYNELLMKYLNDCDTNEPILIEDIKNYFQNIITKKDEYISVIKNIYVYLNRLVKKDKLVLFAPPTSFITLYAIRLKVITSAFTTASFSILSSNFFSPCK